MKTRMIVLLALLMPSASFAHDFPAPNGTPVVDAANIIPADREAAMVGQLLAYEKRSGHQLMVATVPSLDGDSIESYAQDYFRKVRIGTKDKDDGTLFLIAPKEHRARIQTGYGMRTILTDAQTSAIQQDDVIPKFKAGDYPSGIEAGVASIIRATTPLTPAEMALVAHQRAAATQRHAELRAKVTDFFMTILGILGIGAAGFGAFKVATIPARRKAARELAEQQEAERQRLAEEEADRQRQEEERQESARKAMIEERRREEAREKARLVRIAFAKKAREDMLNAMTPKDRQAFLDKEEADRQAERERIRLAEEAAAVAAAAAERRRAAEWEAGRPAREAAAAAEEARQAEARRRRDEEEEDRRRTSYSSSSYSSSSDYGSSSSDSSWSGGGGDSGGGGSSSSW